MAEALESIVEAAAREAFWQDDLGGHIKGRWTWETIPEEGRENYRKMIRAALDAAHDPALDLDRSVCLRDVVEALRGARPRHKLTRTDAADFIEREFGASGG